MGLERFGRLLIEISELSRDEMSIVFIQLAKDFGFCVEAKKVEGDDTNTEKEQTFGNPTKSRKEYTHSEKFDLSTAALSWLSKTELEQAAIVARLANRFGRTEKAIRYQITSRIK